MNSVIRRIVPGFLCFCIAFAFCEAQKPATGVITGRIFSPAINEYVRNAEIRLLFANATTVSEAGGTYRLENVPAGEATVEVNYSGYQTIIEKMTVAAGATVNRDFNLVALDDETNVKDKTVLLETFVVSTEREGSAKAIMEQRTSMNITNTITSEVFGDNAEGNIGEFLRNVPGVTLDTVLGEVRNVGLGGLGSAYTAVTVDGMSLGAADANMTAGTGVNTRAQTFEMASLSSMDGLEVSRTISADVDANAPGGTINLRSKRAFDRKGRRVAWQVNASLHSTEMNLRKSLGPDEHERRIKVRPGGIFEYSDVFFDGRLGVVLNLSESNIYQEADRITVNYNRTPTAADPREQVPTSIVMEQLPRFNRRSAATFTTDYRATKRLILSLSAIFNSSNLWNLQRSVTLNAGPRATVIGDDPVYSFTTNSTSSGVVVNPVATSKLGETITVTPKFEYKLGALTIEGVVSYSDSESWYECLERQGAVYSTNSPSATRVNFRAERNSADSLSTDWKITQISGSDIASGTAFSMPGLLVNDDRYSRGEFRTGMLTGTLTTTRIVPVVWKAGVKMRSEKRTFDNELAMRRMAYVGPAGTTKNLAEFPSPYEFTLGDMGMTLTTLSGGQVFMPDLAAIGLRYKQSPEQFVPASTATDYYNTYVIRDRDFQEDVDAAYVMATATVRRSTIRVGVRREETSTDVLECDALTSNEVKAAGYAVSASTGIATTVDGVKYQFLSRPKVHRRGDYGNNFPSASFKYRFTKNLDLHIGFSSTIRRPNYGDVAGVWLVNDSLREVTTPNIALRPETARNYAARLAYYFKRVGQLSVSVFQNDLKDIIQSSEMTAEEFGYTGEDYKDYKFISNTNGADRVKVKSLEISYGQNLGMLGAPFKRMSVRANYTRSYADFIKSGLIPHAINGGFDYTYGRFNVYANANWTDSFPTTTTGMTMRRHRTQIDAGASVILHKNISLSVSARNLTEEPYCTLQTVPPSAATLYDYLAVGANFTVAIKATY